MVIGGVGNFQISFNGEKMLYQQGDKWTIADPPAISDSPGGPPPKPDNEKTLKTEDLEVKVDPPPNGSRCSTKCGASNAISSTIRNYHGLDLASRRRTLWRLSRRAGIA